MGTLTITTTAPQDARIVKAFGEKLMLGRNATGPEIKAHLIDYIKDVVVRYETNKAAAEAVNALNPLEPS